MQRLKAGVHQLPARKQIARRTPTEREHNCRDQADSDCVRQTEVRRRRVGEREHTPKKSIIEARNAENDRDAIEPGEIAAQDQRDLKQNGNRAGPVAKRRRGEVEPGHDKLSEMIEQNTGFMEPTRRVMQIPAQWIR